jgi:hypothetical protein
MGTYFGLEGEEGETGEDAEGNEQRLKHDPALVEARHGAD